MITQVAIYTRLSPNPIKDDTENQERDLLEYCYKQGYNMVQHYRDIYMSGSRKGGDRPAFKQMMLDARQRKFDLLLFWSLDRLSREGVAETLGYLKSLHEYGVNYRSYTEQWLDSCGIFKDALVGILATIAKQERARIVERTVAGLATARARGKRIGRPRSAIDRVKAREMLDQGYSQSEVAAYFKVSSATISRYLRVARCDSPEGVKGAA